MEFTACTQMYVIQPIDQKTASGPATGMIMHRRASVGRPCHRTRRVVTPRGRDPRALLRLAAPIPLHRLLAHQPLRLQRAAAPGAEEKNTPSRSANRDTLEFGVGAVPRSRGDIPG